MSDRVKHLFKLIHVYKYTGVCGRAYMVKIVNICLGLSVLVGYLRSVTLAFLANIRDISMTIVFKINKNVRFICVHFILKTRKEKLWIIASFSFFIYRITYRLWKFITFRSVCLSRVKIYLSPLENWSSMLTSRPTKKHNLSIFKRVLAQFTYLFESSAISP